MTSCVVLRQLLPMTDLPADDQTFLKDLVKTARRKHHHVKWTDRDGTERITVLDQIEVVRFAKLAHKLGISKPELLRQAAHIPVTKSAPAASAPTAPTASPVSA